MSEALEHLAELYGNEITEHRAWLTQANNQLAKAQISLARADEYIEQLEEEITDLQLMLNAARRAA